MTLHSPERVEGYPSFVRYTNDNTGILNWWAPVRLGDDDADFNAGRAHLDAVLHIFKGLRDPNSRDFYRSMVTPEMACLQPVAILTNILDAMQTSGPIERGFLTALAQKAIAGRAPPIVILPDDRFTEQDREAEEYAQAFLELGRVTGTPALILEELIAVLDGTFLFGSPAAFVWTICVAAAAGALN